MTRRDRGQRRSRAHHKDTRCILLALFAFGGAGCPQERISLGHLEDAGMDPPSDGAVAGDDAQGSTEDAEVAAPSPMSAVLEAHGRSPIVELHASCGAECVQVRARITGGVPPYQVLWDDGVKGAARSLCADPSKPRSAVIRDASRGINAPISVALNAIDYEPCATDAIPTWRTCFAVEPIENTCAMPAAESILIDLEKPLPAGSPFQATLLFGAPPEGLPYMELFGSSELCGTEESLGLDNLVSDRPFAEYGGAPSIPVRYISIRQSLYGASPGNGLPLGTDATQEPSSTTFELESMIVCESASVDS